jgi:hypothetical protein
MIPLSDSWAQSLDQIAWDYCDGFCGYEAAFERLQRECGFDWDEATNFLATLQPPKEAA